MNSSLSSFHVRYTLIVVSIFYNGTLDILSNLHFASLASVALHFPSLHHCYLLPAKIFTVSVSSYLLYFTWHNILQICPSACIVTHHQAIFNSTESLLMCAEAFQWGTMYAYSFALIACTLGIGTAARSHPLCCFSLRSASVESTVSCFCVQAMWESDFILLHVDTKSVQS